MRFLTDATPPNQRRLAKMMPWWNLYRLPNTLKTPLCGDREINNSTPLSMVIPSIEEEEEVEVEEDENG